MHGLLSFLLSTCSAFSLIVFLRLVGDQSDDPHFPKVQWPTPELCPKCHTVIQGGEHKWNEVEVLAFLLNYFSAERILPDYLQEESEAVAQQRALLKAAQQEKDTSRRRAREAQEVPVTQPAQEEEDEEEEVGITILTVFAQISVIFNCSPFIKVLTMVKT